MNTHKNILHILAIAGITLAGSTMICDPAKSSATPTRSICPPASALDEETLTKGIAAGTTVELKRNQHESARKFFVTQDSIPYWVMSGYSTPPGYQLTQTSPSRCTYKTPAGDYVVNLLYMPEAPEFDKDFFNAIKTGARVVNQNGFSYLWQYSENADQAPNEATFTSGYFASGYETIPIVSATVDPTKELLKVTYKYTSSMQEYQFTISTNLNDAIDVGAEGAVKARADEQARAQAEAEMAKNRADAQARAEAAAAQARADAKALANANAQARAAAAEESARAAELARYTVELAPAIEEEAARRRERDAEKMEEAQGVSYATEEDLSLPASIGGGDAAYIIESVKNPNNAGKKFKIRFMTVNGPLFVEVVNYQNAVIETIRNKIANKYTYVRIESIS